MYQNGIKIVLDKIVALMALLLLSPIFILISLVLFLLQNQIFFIQTRVGKDQTRFSIYKFQTMSEERDSNGKLLPDAARINAFGKFLRATSLDELQKQTGKGLEKLFIEVYVPKNQYAIHSYNPENFNLHYTCLKKKPEKVRISLAELLKRAGLEGKEVEIH